MNFLAHLYLSGSDPNVMTGNFIGDFVKGRDMSTKFGKGIARGVELHRIIDEFTDHHPIVRQSKDRLRPKYRHYSGVIIDIFYDHFLAANWKAYAEEPLPSYAGRVYKIILDQGTILPERVNQILPYMMRDNWLVNYAQLEGIQRVLNGMSRRATFDSKMNEATEDLKTFYPEFKSEFEEFFPALKVYSEKWLKLNH